MYDTREEANQKLANTVVMYKNSPVYVRETGGQNGSGGSKLTLLFKHLRTGSLDEACILDRSWEFRDLGSRLGYMNVDLGNGGHKEASYVTRMGVRASHATQGLSQKNLNFKPLKGSNRLSLSPLNLTFPTIYCLPFFSDMLEMKYPDLKDISTQFSKNTSLISKAFSRQFAVRRDDVGPFYLQYRGKDVGYTDDFYRWKISPQYSFLSEQLEYNNLNLKV